MDDLGGPPYGRLDCLDETAWFEFYALGGVWETSACSLTGG